MNFFGIGLPELAVIAAIGLLVFGPKRLPELGRTLGRTLKGFQTASSEFEKEFRTAIATAETPGADPASPAPAAAQSQLPQSQPPGSSQAAVELAAPPSAAAEAADQPNRDVASKGDGPAG